MSKSILADNLRALMTHHKVPSQRAMAEKAGMDQKTVGRILKEDNACTLTQLVKLAAAFDLLPWQMLVPALDPKDVPVMQLSRTERDLYERLKTAATDFGQLGKN